MRFGAARDEIDQARQEARKRLAGWRYEERIAALPGKLEELKLARVQAPAARGEPPDERLRQPSLASFVMLRFNPRIVPFRLTLPPSFTNSRRRLPRHRDSLRCI